MINNYFSLILNYIMPLRSGKEYLKAYRCLTESCPFYGDDSTEMKCSVCFNGSANVSYSPVPLYTIDENFRNALDSWVNEKFVNQEIQTVLKEIAKKKNRGLFISAMNLSKELYPDQCWLTVQFAKELFRYFGGHDRNNLQASHLICPYIVDWWNITRENGFYGYEVCYYGKYGDIQVQPNMVPPKNQSNWGYHINS